MEHNHDEMKHNHNEMKHHEEHNHEHHDHNHHNHEMMEHEHHGNHNDTDHSHMDHSMHGMGNLKRKFFVSLIFAIPIMFISPMMGITLPFQISFKYSEWVVLILSTILFFYGGMPFLKGAKMELKMKNPGMMTLISLGITVAYGYSIYAFVMNHLVQSSVHVMDFFWELASLIAIMLLGHWVEMNAVSDAGNALEKMASLLPKDARVVREDGTFETIPLTEVKIGDVVQVSAGQTIPADGHVIKGNSTVNESMITGESLGVKKDVDDKVIGGSTNGNGTLLVEVDGTGESGYLSQVMTLVSDAQKDKSKNELLSNKVAQYLFYIALFVGLLTFIIWFSVTRDSNIALERLVTVLIIACPHALGLAIPLVVARSTSIAAKNGLLIRNRESFENAHKVDMVLMDKTGTLTYGNFELNHYDSMDEVFTDEDVLSIFASLEQGSSHPLAVGILKKAEALNLDIAHADGIETIPGVGMKGVLNQEEYLIVNEKYLIENQFSYDKDRVERLAKQGNSMSFLIRNKDVIGVVAQGDKIKEASYELIKTLKSMDVEPVMLTGDNEHFAKMVAQELGIKRYYAELKPEDKESIVRKLQSEGKRVMMVGDGVNDAPALARANVGVAIGAGTEVVIDSADVILVKSDPKDILNLLRLSKKTSRKVIENLWWGAGYNFIAIPLAAGILAPIGILLTPAVGAVFMSLSTVIVAINAMLLKLD
ncbi:heavy metal translocating P-type ATPase [Erysipelothrix inopinata]|nr:heavy metal translocating P-type ATPase [Erysipelothrix inopinata]